MAFEQDLFFHLLCDSEWVNMRVCKQRNKEMFFPHISVQTEKLLNLQLKMFW